MVVLRLHRGVRYRKSKLGVDKKPAAGVRVAMS